MRSTHLCVFQSFLWHSRLQYTTAWHCVQACSRLPSGGALRQSLQCVSGGDAFKFLLAVTFLKTSSPSIVVRDEERWMGSVGNWGERK